MITRVHYNNLCRGPRPTYQELIDNGFTTVINLESGGYELFHDDDYEKKKGPWKEVEIACSPITPPAPGQVDKFIKTVNKELNLGGKVYVHCLHGRDRTGYMIAVWRIKSCGWSYKEALAEMYEMNFNKKKYFWWTWVLKARYA